MGYKRMQEPGKPKVIYTNVKETDVPKILESASSGKPVIDLAFARIDNEEHVITGKINYSTDSINYDEITPVDKIESLSRQHRLILRNAGNIDPENINEERYTREIYKQLPKSSNNFGKWQCISCKYDNAFGTIEKVK